MTDTQRLRADLLAVEDRALTLLDRIESLGLIAPGRTESEVEQDIAKLAKAEFGVLRHWHKRIVHCGVNGLAIAREDPPVLTIADDDIVFLDLGPVFDTWEADVGRSYVIIGTDPEKQRLIADLEPAFDALKAAFDADQDATGDALYRFAVEWAQARGWRFGGIIAGHVIGEFPNSRTPGQPDFYRINAANTGRLRDPDPLGRHRFWIGEIHLVSPDGTYGGFYERLLER